MRTKILMLEFFADCDNGSKKKSERRFTQTHTHICTHTKTIIMRRLQLLRVKTATRRAREADKIK